MRVHWTFLAVFLGMFAVGCSKSAPTSEAQQPIEEPKLETASAPELAAEIRMLSSEPARTSPSGKASVVHLAQGKNAYVGRLEMTPGATVPVHRDQTEEYIFFLEGGGMITIDGKESKVSAGAAVYMPANAEVSYVNGDTTSVVVQVFAGPEPAKKYGSWQVVGE